MTAINPISPLHAATADRLERMFRRAEAFADDRDDINLAMSKLPTHCHGNAYFLMGLLAQLACANVDGAVALTVEERIALYVASKALRRTEGISRESGA